MLITEIKDGTLYASVTAKSTKHVIHHGVRHIETLRDAGESRYRFTLKKNDGTVALVQARVLGDLIVVDPWMEIGAASAAAVQADPNYWK